VFGTLEGQVQDTLFSRTAKYHAHSTHYDWSVGSLLGINRPSTTSTTYNLVHRDDEEYAEVITVGGRWRVEFSPCT